MRKHERLIFSLSEFERRLNLVKQEMQRSQIETLLVSQPDNIHYLTGYETTGYDSMQFLIIPLDGEPFSFTRFLEQSNMITRTWVEECCYYQDYDDRAQKLIDLLKEKKRSQTQIGYEVEGMFLLSNARLALEREFSKNLINASGLVERVRAIKSQEELDLMRRVAVLTEKGMQAGIDATQSGVREYDIAAAMHQKMYSEGSHYPSVRPYISSGWKTNVGHATWTDKIIEKNECVFLELSACLDRYHAPMMRTVYTGEVPKNVKEGEKIVLDHLQLIKENMRPGVSAGEIDLLTRSDGRLGPIGATRISRTGYGIGIAFAPSWDEGHVVSLMQSDQTPLQENMTFHLLPWIQFPNDDAVITISETVVVKPNGAESFMNMPLEIVIKP